MEKEPATSADHHHLQDKILLTLLFLLFVAVVIKSAWLSDDAFITLRTVRNFNEGYGLVWNIHERVQAYTHPLWMLLLSLTYFFTTETFYSTLFVSILLATATVALIVWKLAKNVAGGILALLLLTLSKAFIDYSTSGLENPLTHLLLTLFFIVYIQAEYGRAEGLQDKRSIQTFFWLIFIAALGLVNRMDTALFFAPPLFHSLYQLTRFQLWSRRTLFLMVLGSAPFWVWTLFSILYYGFPFPNTAYAKLGASINGIELFTQGIHYLLNSLSIDPITLLAICLAAAFSWFRRSSRLMLIMLGAMLYIAYTVKIGGDFMSGRFLSAPYLSAVLVLSQGTYFSFKEVRTHLLFIGVIVIGLLNPSQSPILSNGKYVSPFIDSTGIADERGHYYQHYGLLSADRHNRVEEQGIVRGISTPADLIHCSIGHLGLLVSPYTRVTDFCGLADAFIARLPAAYEPGWRPGHLIRQVPLGYRGTLRTGINQIHDPDLALFYDKLAVVTQGRLFDSARFLEIWRFNTGAYAHLIDPEMVRFPDILELTMSDGAKDSGAKDSNIKDSSGAGETIHNSLIDGAISFPNDIEFDLSAQGLRVDLSKTRHPTHLDIGLDSDYFDVVYFRNGTEVGRQTVRQSPLLLAGSNYSVVPIPPKLVEQGFDMIRISPRVSGDYLFTYLNLVDLSRLEQEALDGAETNHILAPATELRHVLQLIYYTFYRSPVDRGKDPTREHLLTQLLTYAQQVDPEQWVALPQPMLLSLLAIPSPEIQAVILSHLPQNTLLVDTEGQPQLRYIGSSKAETLVFNEQTVLQLYLHFIVEQPVEEDYSLWFGIKRRKEPANGADSQRIEYDEWMVYDYFPPVPTSRWDQGTLVDVEPTISLDPGMYEITFGFWTPHVRQRLTTEMPEVYWIDLGTQNVEVEVEE